MDSTLGVGGLLGGGWWSRSSYLMTGSCSAKEIQGAMNKNLSCLFWWVSEKRIGLWGSWQSKLAFKDCFFKKYFSGNIRVIPAFWISLIGLVFVDGIYVCIFSLVCLVLCSIYYICTWVHSFFCSILLISILFSY